MGTEARVPIPLHPWFAVSVHVSDLKPTETEDSFLPSICPAKSNVLVLPPAPSFPSFSSIQPWAACPLLSFFCGAYIPEFPCGLPCPEAASFVSRTVSRDRPGTLQERARWTTYSSFMPPALPSRARSYLFFPNCPDSECTLFS